MMRFFLLWMGALASFSIGCANNNLPEFVKLGDLRILALIANTPEVNVGSTVTITPVISDLNGNGRTLSASAWACNDPGIGFGATPTCENSDTLVNLFTDSPVTGLTPPDYTGAATSTFNVTIPANAITQRSIAEVANGVAYLVTFQLKSNDGTTINAFKRIIVSSRNTGLNSNPTLSGVLFDDISLTSRPSTTGKLKASYLAGTSESYSEIQSDGSTEVKEETLTTTWFISTGEVSAFRTEGDAESTFTPPESYEAGKNVLFVPVMRDGRGGTSFLLFTL